MVACFSATDVTKRIADMLAEAIGAKTFEIVPKEIYTDADLNWTNDNSRSSMEMKDRMCWLEIESRVRDLAQYDIIFLGFPVWWYREPSIIDTFVEHHDLAGKVIVPFATSGGSGGALVDQAINGEKKNESKDTSSKRVKGGGIVGNQLINGKASK